MNIINVHALQLQYQDTHHDTARTFGRWPKIQICTRTACTCTRYHFEEEISTSKSFKLLTSADLPHVHVCDGVILVGIVYCTTY